KAVASPHNSVKLLDTISRTTAERLCPGHSIQLQRRFAVLHPEGVRDSPLLHQLPMVLFDGFLKTIDTPVQNWPVALLKPRCRFATRSGDELFLLGIRHAPRPTLQGQRLAPFIS